MKNLILKNSGILFLAIVLFSTGCKKDYPNIYNMFKDVSVTLHNTLPHSITSDTTYVQVGDSVVIDYTIGSSNKGMYTVAVHEAGADIPFLKIPISKENRYSYSDVVKLKMDSKVGRTAYRIYALDSAGVYMGDGYKKFVVEIASDYYYWANRTIFVPDTINKDSKCYFSTTTGQVMSYNDAVNKSDLVDFGYCYTPAGGHTIYNLSDEPLPFTAYDVSGFTKNETMFYCQNRNRQLSTFQRMATGKQIYDVGAKKANKPDPIKGIKVDYLVYFKTANGKYGAIYINGISRDSAESGTYMNVDIKVQK
jgi:hypothetical protein